MLAGSVMFIVMAHAWGPEKFGIFMYPFTIATIIAMLLDYGFALQLMRDIGHNPSGARQLMARALGAKTVLIVPMTLVSVAVGATLPHAAAYEILCVLLLCDAFTNSFAVFFNIPLRALGRFDKEAYIAGGANVARFIVVVVLVILGFGPIPVAAGFVLTRLGYLIASWVGCERALGQQLRPEWTLGPLMFTLRNGFPFAVHITVGTVAVHVETLMIQHYMGASAVGLYQAGMRILLAALLVADALNNVYLNALAALRHDGTALNRLGTRMTRHLLTLGVLAFLCTVGGGDWIVRLLYSHQYDALIPLLPLFGLLMLIRYGGTSYGVLLTLADKQAVRAAAVMCMVFLDVAINVALIPRFGLAGAITSAILSHVALYSVYVLATWKDHRSFMVDWRSLMLVLVAGAALLLLALPSTETGYIRAQIGAILILVTAAIGITKAELGTLSRKVLQAR